MKSISFNNSLILTKNLISALPEKDKNFSLSLIIVKVDGENKTPHHQNLIENILKKYNIFYFFRFQKIQEFLSYSYFIL